MAGRRAIYKAFGRRYLGVAAIEGQNTICRMGRECFYSVVCLYETIARMEKGSISPQLDTILKVPAPLGKTLAVVPLETGNK